jgi:hypothetical protein
MESGSIYAESNDCNLQRNPGIFLGQCGYERHSASLTDSFLQPAIHDHEPVLQFAPGHRSDTRPPTSERSGPAMRVKRREQQLRRWVWMGHWICATVCCLHLNGQATVSAVLCRDLGNMDLASPFLLPAAFRTTVDAHNLAIPDTRRYMRCA